MHEIKRGKSKGTIFYSTNAISVVRKPFKKSLTFIYHNEELFLALV